MVLCHLWKNLPKAVALLRPLEQRVVLEGDLTGPLCILMSLMFALTLQGKVYFEELYAIAVVSIIFSYLLINLMAQKGSIDL